MLLEHNNQKTHYLVFNICFTLFKLYQWNSCIQSWKQKIYNFTYTCSQNMHFVAVNGLFNDALRKEKLFPTRNSTDLATVWMHNNKITQAQVLPILLFLASAILPWKHFHSFCHLINIMASYDKPNSMSRESKIICFVHKSNHTCLPSFSDTSQPFY